MEYKTLRERIEEQAAFLLEENQKDIANAREKGMKESLNRPIDAD